HWCCCWNIENALEAFRDNQFGKIASGKCTGHYCQRVPSDYLGLALTMNNGRTSIIVQAGLVVVE
ncbi:hypothetical protein O6490_24495, partial [Salmonella enterica subsp. enterica]